MAYLVAKHLAISGLATSRLLI